MADEGRAEFKAYDAIDKASAVQGIIVPTKIGTGGGLKEIMVRCPFEKTPTVCRVCF